MLVLLLAALQNGTGLIHGFGIVLEQHSVGGSAGWITAEFALNFQHSIAGFADRSAEILARSDDGLDGLHSPISICPLAVSQ